MQTIKEAIAKAGIDEKKAISSLKRSRAGAQRADRPKVFASSLGKGLYLTDQHAEVRRSVVPCQPSQSLT